MSTEKDYILQSRFFDIFLKCNKFFAVKAILYTITIIVWYCVKCYDSNTFCQDFCTVQLLQYGLIL